MEGPRTISAGRSLLLTTHESVIEFRCMQSVAEIFQKSRSYARGVRDMDVVPWVGYIELENGWGPAQAVASK